MVAMDLAKLASLRDPRSKDTFLSVYVDVTDPRYADALDRRARAIRGALAKDDLPAFDAMWADARKLLGPLVGRRALGAAVFVSKEHALREALPLDRPIGTRVVLDSGPYVKPLARFLDEYESFLLAVVDSESATVYTVEAGAAEVEHRRRLDLIGRHKKGGMSQMRYQRHRQGIKDKLHEETIDQLTRLVQAGEARRIVVAGPGPAKRQLLGRLPRQLADLVIGVEDTEDAGEIELARFLDLAREHEKLVGQEVVERLRAEIRRGGLALTGAFDVARAARDGRVDVLLVEKDRQAGASKCEAHETFFETGRACMCGNAGTSVDLLNEAVEAAIQSDAEIEFVPAREPFLSKEGGAGALLRW